LLATPTLSQHRARAMTDARWGGRSHATRGAGLPRCGTRERDASCALGRSLLDATWLVWVVARRDGRGERAMRHSGMVRTLGLLLPCVLGAGCDEDPTAP